MRFLWKKLSRLLAESESLARHETSRYCIQVRDLNEHHFFFASSTQNDITYIVLEIPWFRMNLVSNRRMNENTGIDSWQSHNKGGQNSVKPKDPPGPTHQTAPNSSTTTPYPPLFVMPLLLLLTHQQM